MRINHIKEYYSEDHNFAIVETFDLKNNKSTFELVTETIDMMTMDELNKLGDFIKEVYQYRANIDKMAETVVVETPAQEIPAEPSQTPLPFKPPLMVGLD